MQTAKEACLGQRLGREGKGLMQAPFWKGSGTQEGTEKSEVSSPG